MDFTRSLRHLYFRCRLQTVEEIFEKSRPAGRVRPCLTSCSEDGRKNYSFHFCCISCISVERVLLHPESLRLVLFRTALSISQGFSKSCWSACVFRTAIIHSVCFFFFFCFSSRNEKKKVVQPWRDLLLSFKNLTWLKQTSFSLYTVRNICRIINKMSWSLYRTEWRDSDSL